LETGRYISGRYQQDLDWVSPIKLGVTEENGDEYGEKG